MKLKPIHGLLLLIALISFPLFTHLGDIPIQLWDEGRLAMKALEMTTSHNWLITTVNGKPDMANVKPPLLIWIQAIFIKVMGPNELAIRLPSALAALATCILIYWFFAWKYFKDVWLGIIINLLLTTCLGFVTLHGTRSGDYDALLTLLTTGFVLFFFLYLEEGNPKYLNITIALLIATVYTKGIQGLMFLPALLIYVIAAKKSTMLFKEKRFYIGALLFVILSVGYYLAREHYNPGYIHGVWVNELGGRYGEVMENHKESFFYFFSWIYERAFTYWYLALLMGMIAIGFTKDTRMRRLMMYVALVGLTYMLVISSAQTKCWWYIMPAVPYMAIIAGIFINTIFKTISDSSANGFKWMSFMPLAFLIWIVGPAYANILQVTLDNPSRKLWDYVNGDMTEVLYGVANKNSKDLDGYTVLGCYEDNVTWYAAIIQAQHKPVQFVGGNDPGNATKVVAFRNETKTYLDATYDATLIYANKSVYYYVVKGKKK